DVLSEGLDLHAASVIVHLDLPWNPARLEQRVGRVRRLGSTHETVHVYAFAPPASSERVLRVEQRLRAKLRIARGMIGLGGYALWPANPSPSSSRRSHARWPPSGGGGRAAVGDARSHSAARGALACAGA